MGISPTTFPAFRSKISLTRFGKVELQIAGFGVMNLRTDRNFN
jgi:hypothetical protein